MRKKWLLFGIPSILLAAMVWLFIASQPKVVNDWNTYDERPVVLNNKVWQVMFSEKISESSVNGDLLYVTNADGEKQEVSLSFSENQKSIEIHPPDGGYDLASEFYTLHIMGDVKAITGRALQSGEELSFVVKENLPVVGSKNTLDGHFLQVIADQKESRKRSFFGGTEQSEAESSGNMDQSSAADTSSSEGQISQDVSETNVQVQGIDEADVVKTDGNYIYQVVDRKITITKAVPADNMEVQATLSYDDSFSPNQIFLHKDQLVVIGHSYNEPDRPMDRDLKSHKGSDDQVAASSMPAPMYHSTKAIVYDVGDRANPKPIREVEMEGSLITSRKMDGIVYLTTNYHPDYWILEKNKEVDLRPRFSDSALDGDVKRLDYDEMQYIPDSKETNYTTIAAFNLEEPSKEANFTTYLGSGNQLYMSKDNLYLSVTNYPAFRMEQEGDFVPNTSIYKFSINGDEVTFDRSAEVQGTVLNQFSMDEYQGHFRIATTKGNTWNEKEPSANNLYILDENLKQVGQLENLARGERIYSARFMQDRIYVVTFKEVDPLFVIDASNPKDPEVLGELKIPGFSNYLHPYDEDHVIGFGHDTKLVSDKNFGNEPRVLMDGIKISLFDVSDTSNPKERFTEIIGGRGTRSPLNHDHKALLYNQSEKLFAFPISVYQNVEGSGYEQKFEFQGAYVYNIDLEKGFKLMSKITHMEGKHQYEEWESGINRILYIGDTLYALSPSKVTAHDMKEEYEKIGEVSLSR
jgi:inhibitor of cysteine peptidase